MSGKLLIASVLAVAATTCFAVKPPQTKISNGLIHAKVYLPNAKIGYYRGTRFDWLGVVADLKYAGHNYYPEWFQRTDPKIHDFNYEGASIAAGPCTAIAGTPEEFMPAMGYGDAKAGQTFIKIGVGVLRKPDDGRYDNYHLYDIVDGGKWTVNKQRNSVEFTQELSDTGTGYSYVYRKTISLTKGKPQMVLTHSLRNTGKRVIRGGVYDHNFWYLDKQAPGPGVDVTFPFAIRTGSQPNDGLAEIKENRIVYLKALVGEDRFQTGIQGYDADAKDYDIKVENHNVGAGVRITGDRPLSRMFLWSIRAPLAVEPFIGLNIEPGAEFIWTLTYDYYTLSKNGN